MGSGASIESASERRNMSQSVSDHNTVPTVSSRTLTAASSKSKIEKRRSIIDLLRPKPKEEEDSNQLVNSTSKRDSVQIFEEPLPEAELEAFIIEEASPPPDVKKERRLSRNILSGEVNGNVLQAQFSMKSLKPTSIMTSEYLLAPNYNGTEGDKPHPTSLADLRKNMRENLTNELLPAKSLPAMDALPNLQEMKRRKSGLDSFASLPNLPPIGQPFPDKAMVS